MSQVVDYGCSNVATFNTEKSIQFENVCNQNVSIQPQMQVLKTFCNKNVQPIENIKNKSIQHIKKHPNFEKHSPYEKHAT